MAIFVPGLVPPAECAATLTFVLSRSGDLLVIPDDPPRLPAPCTVPPAPDTAVAASVFLGRLGDVACFAQWGPDTAPAGAEYRNLREMLTGLHEPLGPLAGRARQLLEWDRDHRYCGRCGTPMQDKGDERAKTCPACAHLCFPRVSPAIIVGITHGDAILLCRNRRFPGSMHSIVAGFVDVGETLEQTVEREVAEEVGLQVRDIRYFGSQSWPFPSGLMLGFTAVAESGEIRVDGDEIVEAGWYTAANLPLIPRPGSISRRIIESLLRRGQGEA
jgi:NAD+ diphosphatase